MKRITLALVLILTWALNISPVAAAPATSIQVLDQSVESHFPDNMTFQLSVRSDAGDIVEATLYLEVGWAEAIELVVPEPFTPAPEVQLTAIWTTGSQTVPPFIEIIYHWQLTDANGETFSTEPVQTEYADTNHDWERLQDEHAIVLWYDRPSSFGEDLFRAAQEAYDHVANITGTTTDRPIRIVIYNTQADFCVMYSICETWVGGQTFSGITVQWGTDRDWLVHDVVPHELAHVFYGEVFRDTWVNVPTWFNEGIAVYNERTDHSEEMGMVRDAAEEGRLRSLPVMTRGGGVAHGEVGLWYAIAYSLVAYVADAYGEETLGELILTLAGNTRFEEALAQTTGLDMAQLELEWRAWLGYPVESVPTPITLPTMAITPMGLPTVRQSPSTSTPSPQEETSTSTPSTPPEGAPPSAPCLGLLGAMVPAGFLIGWRAARRKREHPASADGS
ncbi:MAG: peptidase MA family metallohydrolase [Anaerolineae bacterium]|jgi:hypothetical protein